MEKIPLVKLVSGIEDYVNALGAKIKRLEKENKELKEFVSKQLEYDKMRSGYYND